MSIISHSILINITVQVSASLVQEFSLSITHWLLPLVVDGVTPGLLCRGGIAHEGEGELILFAQVSEWKEMELLTQFEIASFSSAENLSIHHTGLSSFHLHLQLLSDSDGHKSHHHVLSGYSFVLDVETAHSTHGDWTRPNSYVRSNFSRLS